MALPRALHLLPIAAMAACTADFTNSDSTSTGGSGTSTSSASSTSAGSTTSSSSSVASTSATSTSAASMGGAGGAGGMMASSSSSGAPTCATTTCDPHATCSDAGGAPVCTCDPGYTGDGSTCAPLVGEPGLVIIEQDRATTMGASVTLTLQEPLNLLVNPSAEAGNLSGWNVTLSGGNGWQAGVGDPPLHLFGAMMFFTSYAPSTKRQTIDLVAAGYSAAELDASPPIRAREWRHGGGYTTGDKYWLTIEVRDANNAVLASYTQGTPQSPLITQNAWQLAETTFAGYPAGARFVTFTDGGSDTEFWAGNYGVAMDAASVSVGAMMMRFSNDGMAWSAWQPFASTAPWTLAAGTGTRTVYVEYQDASGAIWSAVTDSIVVQ